MKSLIKRQVACSFYVLLFVSWSVFGQEEASTELHAGLKPSVPLKQLHLISSINRDGLSIQLEEFLDLEARTQLLQFSWHNEEDGSLATKRISVLVLNDKNSFLLVKYQSYHCEVRIRRREEAPRTSIHWLNHTESIINKRHETDILESIISDWSQSPYRMDQPMFEGEPKEEATIFGTSSLWIRALLRHQLDREDQPKSWLTTSEVPGVQLRYTIDGYSNRKGGEDSDDKLPVIGSIELRRGDDDKLIDLISIEDVDFKIDQEMDRVMFQFPVSYGCTSNVFLPTTGARFIEYQSAGLVQDLEMVTTRYKQESEPETSIRLLTFARLKHPSNKEANLSLFESLDDHLRIIRDYNSRIEFTVSKGEDREIHCKQRHLHLSDLDGQQVAAEPFELDLGNSLAAHLTDKVMDSLLDPIGENHKDLRYLLNIIRSEDKEEYVYESRHIHGSIVSIDRKSDMFAQTMSVVRVYERPLKPQTGPGERWKKPRAKALELKRVTITLYNEMRDRKLVELRLNLLARDHLPSFSRRAKLFDMRPCYADQLQLKVEYLEDPKFASYITPLSHHLVEAFYLNSVNHKLTDQLHGQQSDERRMARSLNFLRVPSVEVRSSPSNGQIELLVTVIEKSSPLYQFEQQDHSSFTLQESYLHELLMASDAEECARFCQLHHCRMFAFNWMKLQCKLSPVSIEDDKSIEIFKSVGSNLYFAPTKVEMSDDRQMTDEVSLSELLAYISHVGVGTGAGLSRAKREADSSNLLSLEVDDRSSLASEFSPTQRRRLTPNRIFAPKVPILIDLAAAGQKSFVASSFRSKLSGKSYQLNKLDDKQWTPEIILDANERVFINKKQGVYLTLRRLYGIKLTDCETLCYNIDNWDDQSSGGQVCTGFSYCSSLDFMQKTQNQCIMAMRTDINFTSSLLELVSEGDVVHEINSEEELLVDSGGCVLSSRNSLDKYDGPMKLPDFVAGYDSFPGGYTNYEQTAKLLGTRFEWLPVTVVESSQVADDSLIKCAEECNRRHSQCLAFDFCIGTRLISERQPEAYYSTKCLLFLTKQEGSLSAEQSRRARELLVQPADYRISKSRPTNGMERVSTCSRYLSSLRHNFSHLKQHKLSAELAGQLQRLDLGASVPNLDDCINECYHQTDCLALQYCSSFDQLSLGMKRTCDLFGYPKDSSSAWQLTLNKTGELAAKLSQFDRDCHVYLNRKVASLASLLTAERQQDDDRHGGLTLWLTILVCCAAILVFVGVIHARQRGFI